MVFSSTDLTFDLIQIGDKNMKINLSSTYFVLRISNAFCFLVSQIVKFHVQGVGILSEIYRQLVGQMDSLNKSDKDANIEQCIPIYTKPDVLRLRTAGK